MRIKRMPAVIIVFLLIMTIGVAGAAGAGFIKLTLNGQEVELTTPPIMQNGRVMVPLRLVSELFGAGVSWDSKRKTVNISYQEPFANDSPLGSLMLVEDVTINDDGTWEVLEPGVCWFNTGYSYLLAYYTADNLKPGPHTFLIDVKTTGGTAVKSLLNTYEVGQEGYFRMYEEVPTYFPHPGKYYVELSIDGKVVSKTVIVAEKPQPA